MEAKLFPTVNVIFIEKLMFLVMFSSFIAGEKENIDVIEGDQVSLECR